MICKTFNFTYCIFGICIITHGVGMKVTIKQFCIKNFTNQIVIFSVNHLDVSNNSENRNNIHFKNNNSTRLIHGAISVNPRNPVAHQ